MGYLFCIYPLPWYVSVHIYSFRTTDLVFFILNMFAFAIIRIPGISLAHPLEYWIRLVTMKYLYFNFIFSARIFYRSVPCFAISCYPTFRKPGFKHLISLIKCGEYCWLVLFTYVFTYILIISLDIQIPYLYFPDLHVSNSILFCQVPLHFNLSLDKWLHPL